MSSLAALINRLRGRLQAEGIPFVVGGSFALAAAGHPRFTQDVDVMVLVADERRLQRAMAPPGFLQINEITYQDEETGLYIDLLPVEDDAQRAAFETARPVELHGSAPVRVLAPEGLALMLLREAETGDRMKRSLRFRDIESMATTEDLDWTWIRDHATSAGLERALAEVETSLDRVDGSNAKREPPA